ncbi:MAG: DUF2334 domain-containing protein [Deltaproteobacteria bacterium]|nr:DUF2334 domain-containing protein [Deltaproteobacteria bacterium]
MTASYIFRLDDIAPNMLWDRYVQLKEIFSRYSVRPLIAVVPQNEDPEFLQYPAIPVDFWSEIRERQSEGWHVALHGYRHCYDSKSAGLLGVSCRSEFAGHPYQEQLDRIQKGKDIFERESIRVETFVAPSHSYDDNTLRALRESGIRMVSDGFTPFPYREDGLLFVPQLVETPRWCPFGLHTFCLHSNTMSDHLIARVERFLAQNHRAVISFEDAQKFVTNNPLNRLAGTAARAILRLKRGLLNP